MVASYAKDFRCHQFPYGFAYDRIFLREIMFFALVIILAKIGIISAQNTCPGFPGYCSESFPGQTCIVVCSRGRPNVPLCQVNYAAILNFHTL